jgi:hypothetical protein
VKEACPTCASARWSCAEKHLSWRLFVTGWCCAQAVDGFLLRRTMDHSSSCVFENRRAAWSSWRDGGLKTGGGRSLSNPLLTMEMSGRMPGIAPGSPHARALTHKQCMGTTPSLVPVSRRSLRHGSLEQKIPCCPAKNVEFDQRGGFPEGHWSCTVT